jgi:beta-N-acetylhexosaminidase
MKKLLGVATAVALGAGIAFASIGHSASANSPNVTGVTAAVNTASGGSGLGPVSQTSTQPSDTRTTSTSTSAAMSTSTARVTSPVAPSASTTATAQAAQLPIARAVGQLLIGTYTGASPPASMLAAVRKGQIGAIILMGDNTTSLSEVRLATSALQAAARQGGNPSLLIMTDQEGGQVARLKGEPPGESASQMGVLASRGVRGLAEVQQLGLDTARVLKRAGINMDLAPVADVADNLGGFINQQQRSFGADPTGVANAVCRFAAGLTEGGVGYTLKHFPGLGDAGTVSTDTAPVTITLGADELNADDAAYRKCGGGSHAAVMVSSASYPHLSGELPAVISPSIYAKLLPQDNVHGLIISDSLSAGAIAPITTPALKAFRAGLDMAMYPNVESDSAAAYSDLLADVRTDALSQSRVRAAVAKVLGYKQALGLGID